MLKNEVRVMYLFVRKGNTPTSNSYHTILVVVYCCIRISERVILDKAELCRSTGVQKTLLYSSIFYSTESGSDGDP